MATRNVKIQLPCTPETLALLKDLSHECRTPLNHLIVNADPLVMGILRDDLEQRTRHNATKQRN